MRARARALRFATALAVTVATLPPAGAQSPAGGPALEERLRGCARCHGADGNSTQEGIPSLAGQPETFIVTQLILFREGLRGSEQMTPEAADLDDDTVLALAAHFAALPARANAGPAEPELMARGRVLARAGRCNQCHLPDFSGRAQIPRLAGQREDYLAATLSAYRDGARGGADTTMIAVMADMGDADIRALAHFLSRQNPGPGSTQVQ
jgi:cytochrome c553